MAKSYFIALGPKANGFFDQFTGITVAPGEKVEINERQRNSKRISMALNTGHLVMVQPEAKIEKNDQKAVENLDKKLKKAFEKGATLEKLCKDITFDQAKALAEFHEIEVDANDTVQVLIEAVVEDYKGEE